MVGEFTTATSDFQQVPMSTIRLSLLRNHHPPGDAAELIYASWSKSNAQLMVLDHELRIVLWSRGMVEAAFGLEPEIGTSLEALPFPSADHRARAVASVSSMMDAAPAGTIFHPHRALSAVTHAKPSVIIHLSSHVSVGLNAATDIVFCMSAAKIIASSVRASGDAVPPLSSGAPYHVLVMGKESQFDPSLSSLVNTEASYNEQRSDVVSDLTSGEWLGSTPVVYCFGFECLQSASHVPYG